VLSLVEVHLDRNSESKRSYKCYIKSLTELFHRTTDSETASQQRFISRAAKKDENVDIYYSSLRILAQKAYGTLEETQLHKIIGDRFVSGMESDAFRADLYKYLDANGEKGKANQYKNLCDYARSIETIYNSKFFDTKTINRVQFSSNSHPFFMQNNRRSIHFNQKSCRLCRQFGHISESCPIIKFENLTNSVVENQSFIKVS